MVRRNGELRDLIVAKGLRTYEVAEEIGISRTTLYNWLSSKVIKKSQKESILEAIDRLVQEREAEENE